MRTSFLIDGFNLYHSIIDLENDIGIKTKWLDIHSLLSSYLPNISPKASLNTIYYFTAFRYHLQNKDPNIINRHRSYIKVLKSFGINFEFGRFKPKKVYCKNCHTNFTKYEEKETDIAIINKLWDLVVSGNDNAIVIVTGDTDIIPGIKTIKEKFPHIKLFSLFPYKRRNDELGQLMDGYFSIKKLKYQTYQLPNPFELPNGNKILKPKSW